MSNFGDKLVNKVTVTMYQYQSHNIHEKIFMKRYARGAPANQREKYRPIDMRDEVGESLSWHREGLVSWNWHNESCPWMLRATLTIMRPGFEWQQGEEKRNQLDIAAVVHLRGSDIQRWFTGIWNIQSETAELGAMDYKWVRWVRQRKSWRWLKKHHGGRSNFRGKNWFIIWSCITYTTWFHTFWKLNTSPSKVIPCILFLHTPS